MKVSDVVDDTLFSLVASEGDLITKLDLLRAPGYIVRTELSRPGTLETRTIRVEQPLDLARTITVLDRYLSHQQVLEVMDGFSGLGPEFAAAIAELKLQRYGLVRASGP